ncbi:membrane protein [Aureimonas sp. SA4125]|uniref:FtsX-like permease family protein n=1 Tax=Aureimonas sp. SA4125 TaxID=2826993 RepID=UPI001CC7F1EC|nr:ABC transporter permease [Aureimonas sp. SA4125]BDA86215.1 membrane protein [Aureimonas sp. SA4125]
MNPFPIVKTLYDSNRATILLFIGLVALAVALGVAVSAQERALRQGSARAADRFDLIVAAPGSQTDILMNVVYLQPSAVELLAPETVARLLAEPKATLAAPIAFGDSVAGFSVVGTTAAFVDRLSGPLAEGRSFAAETEAVVGFASPYPMGATLRPAHGHGAAAEGPHDSRLMVVGRMARTGTPWDTAIVVPVEQNWRVHGLPTGHPPGETRIGPPFDSAFLPGVPAVVLSPDTVPSAYGLRSAYRSEVTTAFFPAEVLVQLYAVLGDMRSVMDILTFTTQLLVVAAILAGLMALIQLQTERLAVLRALGASRWYIFAVVWTGVTAMIAIGSVIGILIGYGLAQILSIVITRETGIAMTPTLGKPELILAALVVAVGGLVALLPAALLHRRPLAETLRG